MKIPDESPEIILSAGDTRTTAEGSGFARRFLPGIPRNLRLAILFYLGHLFCLGWIASSEIFLGLSVIFAALAIRRGELTIRYHPLYFPLAVFLAGSALSAVFAPEPFRSLLLIGEWFSFLVFPLSLSLFRSVPRSRLLAVRTLIVLVLFLSFYGLFQYFVLGYGHSLLEKRITGPTAHVMTLSGIVMPISLLVLTLAFVRRRPLLVPAALLTVIALVLTFTRGAWIGWVVGLAVLLVRRRPWAFAWMVPAILLALTLSPLPVFGRFISSFDVRQSSNLDRIRMVEAGIEMIRDHPLVGAGPSRIKEMYPLYRKPDAPRFRIPHLHNNFVQVWAERGLVAEMGYLLLILLFTAICLRTPRSSASARVYADAGLAIVASLTTAGLFEFNFGDTEVLLTMLNLFALCLAMIEAESAPGAA